MKIYTKTGDDGSTGLYGGGRLRKDAPRVQAMGDVDETNAAIGLVRACRAPPDIDALLYRVQNELFDLGAELATIHPDERGTHLISLQQIEMLEADIDRFEATLPPLMAFILPGGCPAAAAVHLARTVCRRAERTVQNLLAETDGTEESVSPQLLVYLNRLSDLLFVLGRAVNQAAGVADVKWTKRSG